MNSLFSENLITFKSIAIKVTKRVIFFLKLGDSQGLKDDYSLCGAYL